MDEFVRMMRKITEETRKEEGCLRFDFLRSQEHDYKFTTYEIFKNEAALAAHMEMPHTAMFKAFAESGAFIGDP